MHLNENNIDDNIVRYTYQKATIIVQVINNISGNIKYSNIPIIN